tara:strand:+ start:319 stop:543 length:225 start_codon:yes stop_codon:yes gene_type:complete
MQESLMIVLFRPVPRLRPLLWPGLTCAAGIEERPIALHAAFTAALFIISVVAFLRFLFFTFNDIGITTCSTDDS